MPQLLRDRDWKLCYSHEDGDLIAGFFEPALSRAVRYRRATGYFTLDVLRVAARGLDGLVRSGGRMELLVGCTLGEEEVEEIRNGYELREAIARNLTNQIGQMGKLALAPSAELADREGIGHLARLVALGTLDVKVAVPLDAQGRVTRGGLYHNKLGIIEDAGGDRLTFRGSINETSAGWLKNTEAFDVNLSWHGGNDAGRVATAEKEFEDLWEGRTTRSRVIDVPDAVKEELLRFLPDDDQKQSPPPTPAPAPEPQAEPSEADRDAVWRFLKAAPARPLDGLSVSLRTGVVEPWPHQIAAYRRMVERWPFRLLVADEVGLGKTIEAGLVLRHAALAGLSKRTLVMVPAGVMLQWQAELYEKFNLRGARSTTASGCSGRRSRTAGGRRWKSRWSGADPEGDAEDAWHRRPLVIASSHLMRRRDRAAELLAAEPWGLMVVDEAHHARRKGAGAKKEGGPNRLLQLLQEPPRPLAGLAAAADGDADAGAPGGAVGPARTCWACRRAGTRQTFLSYFDRRGGEPRRRGAVRPGRAVPRPRGGATARPTPEALVERLAAAAGCEPRRSAARRCSGALREAKATIPVRLRLDAPQRRMALALLQGGRRRCGT